MVQNLIYFNGLSGRKIDPLLFVKIIESSQNTLTICLIYGTDSTNINCCPNLFGMTILQNGLNKLFSLILELFDDLLRINKILKGIFFEVCIFRFYNLFNGKIDQQSLKRKNPDIQVPA